MEPKNKECEYCKREHADSFACPEYVDDRQLVNNHPFLYEPGRLTPPLTDPITTRLNRLERMVIVQSITIMVLVVTMLLTIPN